MKCVKEKIEFYHKDECRNIWDDEKNSFDVNLKSMLPSEPTIQFLMNLSRKKTMKSKPKVTGKCFLVKVEHSSLWVRELVNSSNRGAPKYADVRILESAFWAAIISKKSGAFCLVDRRGPGASTHAFLAGLVLPSFAKLPRGNGTMWRASCLLRKRAIPLLSFGFATHKKSPAQSLSGRLLKYRKLIQLGLIQMLPDMAEKQTMVF